MKVGNIAVQLGAGRLVADEPVDAMSGFLFHVKEGDYVKEGSTIAKAYTNKSQKALDLAIESLGSEIKGRQQFLRHPKGLEHPTTSGAIFYVNGMRSFAFLGCFCLEWEGRKWAFGETMGLKRECIR